MTLALSAMAAALALLLGMLGMHLLGRRVGQARLRRDAASAELGSGAVEAAVFGLLGLLLAFTFSGAASRFEARRHLVTEEANDIGTAYLRLDVLPADAQPALRQLFRDYLEVRIDAHRHGDDLAAKEARLAETARLQRQIWDAAAAAAGRPEMPTSARQLLLPALNEMIDITTTRAVATQNHPPTVIFALLFGLCLLGAALVGHSTAAATRRVWFHPVIFAATMALTLYVVIDLEYPRRGLIRVDAADQVLIDLRGAMQPG
jgi:hypothetical protein